MSKHTIKHTCGHREVHVLVGNSRVRADRERWLEGTLCTDCYREQKDRERREARTEAAEKAQAVAVEYDLPALTGTEKQVDWAMRIRQECLDTCEKVMEHNPYGLFMVEIRDGLPIPQDPEALKAWLEPLKVPETQERARLLLLPLFYAAVASHPDSRWWIDHRDALPPGIKRTTCVLDRGTQWKAWEIIRALQAGEAPERIVERVEAEAAEKERAATVARRQQAQAEEDATLRPANAVSPVVVVLGMLDGRATAHYPRDEAINELLYPLGFEWCKSQGCRLTLTCLRATDRFAEASRRLLAAGYAVRCHDADARAKALAGDFQPYTGREIWRHKDGKAFLIRWLHHENWYAEAKRLPSARYEKPYVKVPASAWVEIEEFAERGLFEFSPGARELLETQRQLRRSILPEPVGPLPEVELPTPGRPELAAEDADDEIPAHLLDEDA